MATNTLAYHSKITKKITLPLGPVQYSYFTFLNNVSFVSYTYFHPSLMSPAHMQLVEVASFEERISLQHCSFVAQGQGQ
jgi:hypothetical protein